MSIAHIHISSFNAGEISPLLGSRFGVEKVASGCRQLRNMLIHPHGPAFRRPGLERMGAAATHASRSNLRSFTFSATTVFILDLSEFGLRVWKDGALVPLVAPVLLPYSAADLPAVQMCQVNDVVYLTHRSYEPRKLTRFADNDWRLESIGWRWPALLDENPGSQALPDVYVPVNTYDFTPYWQTFEVLSGFESSGDPSSKMTISFTGSLPSGTKAVWIEYFDGTWKSAYSAGWTGGYPPAHPIVFTGSNAGLVVGALNASWRVRYHGPSWGASGKITFTQQKDQSPAPPIITTKYHDLSNPVPAAPGIWQMPAGAYRLRVTSPQPNPVFSDTAIVLESRVSGAGGPFSTWATVPLITGAAHESFGILDVARDFRWRYNGFVQPPGAVAEMATISLTAPFQTSLKVSNETVGTGRTLTSNRPLFRPGHIGAYWQLTHRRENAFSEIVSTSAATAASATLTMSGLPVAGETVTIGSRVYTWAASVTTTAGTVAIGANVAAACTNLTNAINGGAGAGSTYGSQTPPHADVTATAGATTVTVVARKPGTGAHAIPVTETMSAGSWGGVWLAGGVDANTVISAAISPAIRINGRWDVLTYGSWETTVYLERQNAAGSWEFVRSWKGNKDRNVAEQGETDGDETLRLRIIAGSASETSNAASPRFVLEATDARMDGLVRITAVGTLNPNGQAVTATCDVIVPCLDTSPTYVWTEGAWSPYRGYPAALALHETRLWFAGTGMNSMSLWGSVTGDIENFRRSSLDDGSVFFTPNAGELNPIQWMLSQGADMVIGTNGNEWTLSGEGKPITPTNVMLRPQSRFGSGPVAATMAGEVVMFVQRGGRKIRRIAQRSNNEPWNTSDVTVLAEHVTGSGVVQMAFGSNPNPILWAVTNDGKLLGMTLEVEQNVFGWHVHETDGLIESVAVVYGQDADEVWVAVQRGAERSIERLDPLVFTRAFGDAERMIFVDAAVRYDGAAVTVVPGLDHLEGRTVSILASGVVQPPQVVAGGQITLTEPASVVVVGLPFESILQPARMDIQTGKGSAAGNGWRVSRVWLNVHSSQGGQVADAPDASFTDLPYPAGGELYSGDVETVIESSTRRGTHVTVKTSEPRPLNVGSMLLKLDVYDS